MWAVASNKHNTVIDLGKMFKTIPSTPKDNYQADCYDESHKKAKNNSDADDSCKCYAVTAVNWGFHNPTCVIHVKACKNIQQPLLTLHHHHYYCYCYCRASSGRCRVDVGIAASASFTITSVVSSLLTASGSGATAHWTRRLRYEHFRCSVTIIREADM